MSRKDHAKLAAEALSDLNMLYAIIAMCENSLMHDCHRQEAAIIRICHGRAGYLLKKYDRHLALASKEPRT